MLAAVVLAVSGCASGAEQSMDGTIADSSPGAVPADEFTQRIAAVEFERQCTVTSQTFPDEAGITRDLDVRLAAAGLTYAQWKDWHDALADSPALVNQLAELSASGCPSA
ncbi:hypothetical protein [Blastococcus saxobsidens]|uniref:hypothetical protein n=1 Tax=Blastococcus saxobsidens TaxID=138336 RepID=UPI0005A25A1C|nr:hypothetical protein [Blastococcus saxobsidens]